MSVNRKRAGVAYGLTNALQNLAPFPITSNRSPQPTDLAEVNTLWTNATTNATYVLSDVTAGQSVWNCIAGNYLTLIGGISINAAAGNPNTIYSATKGSLYIRTDGSSASTRMYINTDGGTTWTNFTTAA